MEQQLKENRPAPKFDLTPILEDIILRNTKQHSNHLFEAIRRRKLDRVKAIVTHGDADVNAKTKYGLTPLHFAAKYATENENHRQYGAEVNDEFVAYLIEQGANLDAQDQNGLTPLHYAAGRDHMQVVRQLIRAGAQTEIPDNEGMTPLLKAVKNKKKRMMNYLIDSQVNFMCVDNKGNSVLHYASKINKIFVLAEFYTKVKSRVDPSQLEAMMNLSNQKRETPLHWAALRGNGEACGYLIKREAKVHMKNENDETALHLMAREGHCTTIKLLLEYGAEINCQDVTLQTPLFKAIQGGVCAAVKVLLERGANVNCFDKWRQTPLILAAKLGKADICAELLRNGADVFAHDSDWNNALFWAIIEKHLPVVQTLVESKEGKNLLDTIDQAENTPLHVSIRTGSFKIANYLLDKVPSFSAVNALKHNTLHVAAMYGRYCIALRLLKMANLSVYGADEDGNLPVHFAAEYGYPQVLKTLLQQSQTLNEKNEYGWTPLMCAAAKNQIECVQVLLEHGADVDSTDKSEFTALFVACQKGFSAVVQKLLERGANSGLRVSDTHALYPGWNALDIAVHEQNMDCVRLIIESDQWKSALNNVVETDSGDLINPLRRMIVQMPEAAKLALTRCVEESKEPENSVDYTIRFNFQFLSDEEMLKAHQTYKRPEKSRKSDAFRSKQTNDEASEPMLKKTDIPNQRNVKQALCSCWRSRMKSPIELMIRNGREELLHHPLIMALLSFKWARMYILYYAHLLAYVLFLALFTSFMLLTEPPYLIKNETMPDSKLACLALQEASKKAYQHHILIPKYGTLIFSLLGLLIELFQLIRDRWTYFNLENCFEVTIYVSTLLTTIDTNWCMMKTGLREDWQWACGTCGLFMAWINLLLFARLGPVFGIFVIMFVSVTRTVAKFFCVFSPFLIAFALSFHVLLANQHAFRNMPNSLLKTFAMTIGELELGEHAFERFSSTEEDKQVHYAFLTYALFIGFLALMCIAMMNLLVGLAVDDIKEVQREAALNRQEMKIKLILRSESMLSRFGLLPRLPGQYYYRPNQDHSIMQSLFHMAYIQYNQTAKELQLTDTEKPLDLHNLDEEVNTIQMQTTAIAKLLNMVVDQLNDSYQPTFFADSTVAAAYSVDQCKEDQSSDVTRPDGERGTLSETAGLPQRVRVNVDEDIDDEPFHFPSW